MVLYHLDDLSTITNIINLSLRNGCFPNDLKLAEVRALFKENNESGKENYRPASVLPLMSKVFEKIIYTQINNFMENKLLAVLTSFSKNHNEHCLVSMIENWKKRIR